MTPRCPDCGCEPVEVGNPCVGCGRLFFGAVILGSATGKQLVTRIDLDVGRHLLRGIVGEEAQYAGEPQFRLVRDRRNGGWTLVAVPGVTNQTWHNGTAVVPGANALLRSGDTVSLAGKCAELQVQLQE